ncbi:MAG: glutamate-1-semialdehyde 2,1-aminomutase [Gammaproteobacteria bacterium]|nr:glutamate-1-semialdehyde 2,1-aminomutase [Gammaproteobacteria bacterium]
MHSTRTDLSAKLYEEARHIIPGGVNSPVRAFGGVSGTPVFIRRAEGAYLFDVNDKKYVDYVGSWGPMIMGHAHPEVVRAVTFAAEKGLSFGAPTEIEIRLAEKIRQHMPSLEQMRMVSSGTEATMTAIRLARGYTKRNKIIKFAGCYHGHVDALLVQAGSGVLTLGVPGSAGVPEAVVQDTLVADFNDLNSVVSLFEKYGNEIAAIIVEPIAGNMNCVLPQVGFLQGLRDVCDRYQSLLIFDEVMTGFRVASGGAQALFNIKPDLTTLGKIIGGGLPVGACGGSQEIMQHLAPVGNVYQAGTLSGNPVAMAAGLATLTLTEQSGFYETLEKTTKKLVSGLAEIARASQIPFQITSMGGMFGFFFLEKLPQKLSEVKQSDVKTFQQFFHAMLDRGIYFAPSAFEAGFVSAAHTDTEIQKTLDAAEEVFKKVLQPPK